MSYIIRKTNDTTLGTILDGTIDDRSKTSLQLIGRNYSNYGQLMVDNLVRLVENFANNNGPVNPLAGQLWYDTAQSRIKVYTGTAYKIIATCAVQSVAPATTVQGDMWYDTAEEQFFIYSISNLAYDPAGWLLIGPLYKRSKGKSGAIWEQIPDNQLPTAVLHDVVSLYLNGNRTAIISRDSDFTPSPAINGFSTVKQGLTANVNLNGGQYFVTANNANYLGSILATDYLRSDINDVTSGTFTIANNGGLTIGVSSNLQITTTSLGDTFIRNTKASGDIAFYTNTAGVSAPAVTINGESSKTIIKELIVSDSTESISPESGAVQIAGGVGILGDVNIAGDLVATTLTGNTSGTADMVRSIVPIQLGGTAANTAAQARDNLGVEIGVDVQAFNINLTALSNLAANGLITRLSNGVATARQIVAGTNITVTNGDGIAANPQISLSTSPALMGTPTAPTPPPLDDSTRIATTEWVRQLVGDYGLAYWAGYTTRENALATYSETPIGTIVSLQEDYSYSQGTGNGGAVTVNAKRNVTFMKITTGNNWAQI